MLGAARLSTGGTGQYFCPIKLARKMLSAHARYAQFLEYGKADDFHEKLEKFRTELAGKKEYDTGK
jgi:hypothetical protein